MLTRRSIWKPVCLFSCSVVLVALASAVEADATPPLDQRSADSNHPRRTIAPSAAAVARELYELQQARGGSVVEEFDIELDTQQREQPQRDTPHRDQPTAAGPVGSEDRQWFPLGPRASERPAVWDAVASDVSEARGSSAPDSQVMLLRQSAWKLEHVAQQLEMSELFDSADAVRDVARILRTDARRPRLPR